MRAKAHLERTEREREHRKKQSREEEKEIERADRGKREEGHIEAKCKGETDKPTDRQTERRRKK